ncbi:30S ribosomal protein 3, chloroplastic-like [Melia azedarach]|uniref:30S ribosomal protein 3, chloroplastic-like n=1 Tax=Melia azedarach TaxID=155640 RepID=A0ACC1XGT8_MELAZ|nr:30S ribosomal protein 3, chloroplastic-like [Melia azedarach]
MLSSMALQSSVNSFTTLKHLNTTNTKTSFIHSTTLLHQRTKPGSRKKRLIALAAPETLTAEASTENVTTTPEVTEKVAVSVKQVEKPRLVLKFIWMEKNIGLALDQLIPGHGAVPLSPYFFWPRKDAWEELKTTLESKPWVSQKKMIILLNQATDIINLWQQSGGNLTS